MGLFGKKKDKCISLEDTVGNKKEETSNMQGKKSQNNNEISQIQEDQSSSQIKGFKFKDLPILISDVEKLKAQSQANSETKKQFDDKFNRLNEQIGRLKSMITIQEKEVSDIEKKATKACYSVENVQPKKLLSEVTKEDILFKTTTAKVESLSLMIEKFKQEVSGLKQDFSKFKEKKEKTKLNEDLSQEINDIKKKLAFANKDANQVQDILVQIQKNYSEFVKFKTIVNQNQELLQTTIEKFDDLKTKTEESLTKKDNFQNNNNTDIGQNEDMQIQIKKVEELAKKMLEVNRIILERQNKNRQF